MDGMLNIVFLRKEKDKSSKKSAPKGNTASLKHKYSLLDKAINPDFYWMMRKSMFAPTNNLRLFSLHR